MREQSEAVCPNPEEVYGFEGIESPEILGFEVYLANGLSVVFQIPSLKCRNRGLRKRDLPKKQR